MLGYAPGPGSEKTWTWWADAIHPAGSGRAMRALKDHIDGITPAFRPGAPHVRCGWALALASAPRQGHRSMIGGRPLDCLRAPRSRSHGGCKWRLTLREAN